MGWQRITDRKKQVRAARVVGMELAKLWEYVPDMPSSKAVHTRAFETITGRHGWLYTDNHVEWDNRPSGPWNG